MGMTPEERAAEDAKWHAESAARAIKRQIADLEESVTDRRKREAILTDAGREWLVNVDSQIATLRAQLVP